MDSDDSDDDGRGKKRNYSDDSDDEEEEGGDEEDDEEEDRTIPAYVEQPQINEQVNNNAFFKTVPTFLVGLKSDDLGRMDAVFEENYELFDIDMNKKFGANFDLNIDNFE